MPYLKHSRKAFRGGFALPENCEVWCYGNNTEGGGEWTDQSGNGNHGSLIGNASVSSGYLTLDGSGDYASFGSIGAADDRTFTYCAWIRTTDTSVGHQVIAEGNSSSNSLYSFMEQAADYIKSGNYDGTNSTFLTGSTTDINDGNWHHLAISCDASTISMYTDNNTPETASLGSVGSSTLNTAAAGALIRTSVVNYFNGDIDDVMIYSGELSAAQISDIYNNSPGSRA